MAIPVRPRETTNEVRRLRDEMGCAQHWPGRDIPASRVDAGAILAAAARAVTLWPDDPSYSEAC